MIEEATKLFALYGFRRASVDAIAAAAQVAKPTLYAYFPDKDALFLAVVDSVLERILATARDAAAREGAIATRLTAVLVAKFTFLFDLVDRSPHAAELLGSSSRLGAERVEEADRKYAAIVRQVVEQADGDELALAAAGVSARKLTEALLRCGHGAAYHSEDAAEHAKHLGELVELVIAGVRR